MSRNFWIMVFALSAVVIGSSLLLRPRLAPVQDSSAPATQTDR